MPLFRDGELVFSLLQMLLDSRGLRVVETLGMDKMKRRLGWHLN